MSRIDDLVLSVKAARLALSAAVIAHADATGGVEERKALTANVREAINDLVAAVREETLAEQPCYRSLSLTDTCRGNPTGEDNPFAGDEPLCAPCAARARRLAEVTP